MTDQPLTARAAYRAFFPVPARWMDNDVYGHINNVHYYSYFDTAIAHYLIESGGLDPWRDPVVGYCVESSCRFDQALRFPDPVVAGVRVGRLGRSSCVYLIGIFKGEAATAAAAGRFVHVFVDRASERPVPIPDKIRAALSRLHEPA